MLMSNPGLHLAILGNPRRWRRTHRAHHRNPRRRRKHHRHHHHARMNPMGAIGSYVSSIKSAPKQIMSTFKGRNKVKHIAFAAGGALATYALGGLATSKLIAPGLAKVPGVNTAVGSPMGQRIVGGMVPVTLGYILKKFVKGDIGNALFVGGAIASIAELAMPGKIGELLAKVMPHPAMVAAATGSPAAGAATAAAQQGPVQGMSGLGTYVDSPSYQGTGALGTYVDSPSYQGTGADDDLATYVDSPSYQGTGEADDDDLAGGERGSYLEEGVDYMASYLN
jgi:hypothetical protein